MKRALIVGINYFGSSCQLSGCINDAHNIKNLLINKFNYSDVNMTVLTDDDVNNMPTKANILNHLTQLVALTQPGDTLFISFSCHGGQIDDVDGDEKANFDTKGQDDVICPVDFTINGYIVDDDLKRDVVNKLPQGAKLRAIF